MTDTNDTPNLSRRSALAAGAAGLAGAAALGAASTAAAQSARTTAMARPLEGKIALVTGAARAIGRAIAVDFARNGAHVALLDIADPDAMDGLGYPLASRDDLEEATELVRSQGVKAVPIVADIRSMSAMRAAVRTAEASLGGPLDIVAANAGVVPSKPLMEMTDADWSHPVDVNLTGTANTLRAVLPGMTSRNSGRIIATASSVGRHGQANIAHYSASKWGVIGLVKSAALEVGGSGVTINAVAPTAVDSVRKPTGEDLENATDYLTSHYNALPIAFLPPEEIAYAVTFLASDKARYITGEIMDVAAGANARYTA